MLNKKQKDKIVDQFRLLSWAQGAIITSSSGFDLSVNFISSTVVVILFITFQCIALYLDSKE